ncbi:hypothetical protein B0I35DRAFT_507320 [Stachybotrys elegans]|uniref:DUF726 domain protein n=1 Tax=Stachybotrys elegans TaxID=80388 RepID=A0A8K0SZF6_9HYPO|nr:hypothetical protein B0I35DRAFT_507320 [Stachybotrys elegans]
MDDRKESPAEAPNSKPQDAAPAPAPAPAPIANEVDDFGLPMRKYVAPPPETTADEGDSAPSAGKDESADAQSLTDKGKGEAGSPTDTDTQEKAGADDSDADDFKDALSEPSPAISKPEHYENPKPSPPEEAKTTPETPTAKSSTEASANQVAAPVLPESAPKTTDLDTDTGAKDSSPDPTAAAPVPPKAPEKRDQTEQAHTRNASTSSAQLGGHTRNTSTASGQLAGAAPASGFSHQQLTTHEEKKGDGEVDDGGWQEMPAYARYDMYDDDDRLIAREHDEAEDEKYAYGGLGGAGKGYTRVMIDDDAESANSMDENTQYLFKQANGTSMVDDTEARDAMEQMQATKDLLTEGQRIAYVGIVRLEIAELVKKSEAIEVNRKTKKMTSVAVESMRMWGQKMMIRLYTHMDISEAEQIMIEQLAEHGVMPSDLTPTLHANSRVKNPMAEKPSSPAEENKGGASSPIPEDEMPAEAPPPYESVQGEAMPDVKTPSELPSTDKIDIDLRWTILCDLFLILIADSIYDARSRILLERVGKSLDIGWIDICRFEKKVTDALEMQQAAEKENWNEDQHLEARRKAAQTKRYVMMGLATVGGGLVIGLSAGLAAPLIGAGLAAGFTTIGVGGTSSFLAGAGGAAIITSGAAASGSYIGGKAANRRTGAVQTFEYRPLHNNKRVNLIITVSGWLTGKVDDVRLPYSTVDPIMGDVYSVLWEPEMLKSMGETINILATEALTQGLQQILASTILMGLMAALQLPIVLTKLAYLIDNPWAVSLDRATAAGLILADSLIDRNLGTRPITLLGYSLGSRVIFSCLQELARKGAYGLVQNVYLFGSPIVVNKDEYIRARTVVDGRFVNGYNRNDWILGYLFRLTSGGIRRVAGLAPIEDLPWIENIDVTELVPGHLEYRTAMPSLLMKCGWVVENEEFTEIEDPDPDNHKDRQRELINEIEEARRALEKEGKKKKRFSLFGRRHKGEREEWEVYEDTSAAGKDNKNGNGGENDETRNQGVLFDVDAIRAELVKETPEGGGEELQVKEIKSTLPPMKIDLLSTPNPPVPAVGYRAGLRETRSTDALPARASSSTRSPHFATPPAGRSGTPVTPAATRPSPPLYEPDEEIQMTFDTAFDEPKSTKTWQAAHEERQERPEMKTSRTLPNMTLSDPWGDPEDDDFGKEKEISMTFA